MVIGMGKVTIVGKRTEAMKKKSGKHWSSRCSFDAEIKGDGDRVEIILHLNNDYEDMEVVEDIPEKILDVLPNAVIIKYAEEVLDMIPKDEALEYVRDHQP